MPNIFLVEPKKITTNTGIKWYIAICNAYLCLFFLGSVPKTERQTPTPALWTKSIFWAFITFYFLIWPPITVVHPFELWYLSVILSSPGMNFFFGLFKIIFCYLMYFLRWFQQYKHVLNKVGYFYRYSYTLKFKKSGS